MRGSLEDVPARLVEQHDQDDLSERIAAHLIRSCPVSPPLTAAAMARIATAIGERAPGRHLRHRVRRAIAVAGFLLGAATVAFAHGVDVLPHWLAGVFTTRPEHGLPPPARPTAAKHPAQTALLRPAPSPRPVPPRLDDTPASAPPAQPSRPPTHVDHPPALNPPSRHLLTSRTAIEATEQRRAPPSSYADNPRPVDIPQDVPLALVDRSESLPSTVDQPPPRPQPSSLSLAAAHLAEAVRALRIDRSPRSALALLDRHADELAAHAFAHETLLLRVEANLLLGRKGDVLRLLDRASLDTVAASQSLLILRGQLRAAADRCAESIRDFSNVLAASPSPPREALWGRAACRSKLGDTDGANADLTRLRKQFPDADATTRTPRSPDPAPSPP